MIGVWVLAAVVGGCVLLYATRILVVYFSNPYVTGQLLYEKTLKDNGVDPSGIPDEFIIREVEDAMLVAKMVSKPRMAQLNTMSQQIEAKAWLLMDILDNLHLGKVEHLRDKHKQDYMKILREYGVIP